MSHRLTRLHIDMALAKASTTKHLVFGSHVFGEAAQLIHDIVPDRPACVIADEHTFAIAGHQMLDALGRANHPVGEPFIFAAEPTLRPDTANGALLRQALLTMESRVFPIAVGSGTINDLVKRAAFEAGLSYGVVATAASMDGYTASGAALIHDGVKQTFECPAPVAVVADVDILRAAPTPMTAAGYGDLIGKVTAGADWLIADALGIEPLIPSVWDLVQGPLRNITGDPERFQPADPGAVEELFCGLVIAGLSIQISGSTRTASGSEHQFSHLWEMRNLEHDDALVSHGFKVGLGTVVATALYERLLARDLTQLDIEQAIARWPTLPAMEQEIRSLLQHPALVERALEECRAKYVSREQLRTRLEVLRVRWPDLRSRLVEQLLPTNELRHLLAKVGCPTEPEHIGLTRAQVRSSYLEARLIRRRYTVFDLAYETGILEEVVQELFMPDGHWGALPMPHTVTS